MLLIHRIVKLNIFFGSLLWTEDHKQLNDFVEYFVMFVKNEPYEIRLF